MRLSLQPCIERILLSWKALSLYFVNNPKDCSKQLFKILQINENLTELPIIIELYFLFSNHALEIFCNAIKELEKSETCASDIFYIMNNLKSSLERCLEQEFFGYEVHQYFQKLDPVVKSTVLEDFKIYFYNVALEYIKKKFDFNDNTPFFKLSKLCFKKSCPAYDSFVEVVEYFKLIEKLKLDMNALFDEVCTLQTHYEIVSTSAKFKSCSNTTSQWHLILKSVDFKFLNIFKIISYVFSVPGTSANTERMFSVMNAK